MLKARAMLAKQIYEPLTYRGVMKEGPYKEQWHQAVQKELRSTHYKRTWELLPLPSKVSNVIDSKWVFKVKYDEEGGVTKFKARLVARGFSQVYGVDYEETYAPTVHYSSLLVLFAITARQGWHLHQLDVVSAYLAGNSPKKSGCRPRKG